MGHSAQELLWYLANLTHLLVQQQGNPNKIRARCQFILIPYDSLAAYLIHGWIESLSPPCYF